MERRLNKTTFLCSDEISIADLTAAAELAQSKFLAYDLSPWPKVKDWLARVLAVPEMDKAHQSTYKLVEMSLKKQARAKL